MKLKVEKEPSGKVRVELTSDSAKKPIAASLTPDEVAVLTSILAAAVKAEKFSFEVQIQ